jgi:hypothetical protein
MCGDADHFPALQLPFVTDANPLGGALQSNYSIEVGDDFAAVPSARICAGSLGSIDIIAMHNKYAALVMTRYCAANSRLSIQINDRNIHRYNAGIHSSKEENTAFDRCNGENGIEQR